jgi:hypothetical protein
MPTTHEPLSDAVRVLMIGATGQSGSTLLSRMLGRLPGFVAVGEVGRIWDKGLVENMECGCGQPFRSCPFWSQVGQEAFGGWEDVDTTEATRLRDAVTLADLWPPHAAALPFILHPNLWPSHARDLTAYASLLGEVYRAIDVVTGGSIVVDSMKLPGHVYLASTMPGFDTRVAHLIRDPRGYAFSNTRWVERQGAVEGAFRPRRSPRKSAVKWTWVNVSLDQLARRGMRSVNVRYEDIVASPRETLRRVAASNGVTLTEDDLAFVHDGEVELVAEHIAAGSRTRLSTGPTTLRADEAWRSEMSGRDRRIVETVTWPLRRRYGYP